MYTPTTHIHFIGIGGIGMSGIALILRKQGYLVSGCDQDISQSSIQKLKQSDCTIYEGNNTTHCIDSHVDVLVYSSAIPFTHPEITAARSLGIPTIPRAVMLAELMRTKYSIAISGSHGKTTTTSIVSHILIEANSDPTVIIGGHLKNISTNARMGDGKFLVAEADESDRSLLYLHATIALLTNIDLEHLETYKDLADIRSTFLQFLDNLPFYGKAIMCVDDPEVQTLLPLSRVKSITYGIKVAADFMAQDITLDPNSSTFHVTHKGERLGDITINMPGAHNALNTLGAIALTHTLGIPFQTICAALKTFGGIERRFSYHGTYRGAELFDDYGHHPTEIRHTLTVAKKRAKGRLIVLFQPHRFSRTLHLWDAFVDVLSDTRIDQLIITDIHAASESSLEGVTAANLVNAIAERSPRLDARYLPFDADGKTIISHLDTTVQADDLLLLLGAGKVNRLAPLLLARTEQASPCPKTEGPAPQ